MAVVKVLSDILLAQGTGDLTVLTFLDLSAAFDTVDPATLLHRLRPTNGLSGAVNKWFRGHISTIASSTFVTESASPIAILQMT
jgi:hypothetical protein